MIKNLVILAFVAGAIQGSLWNTPKLSIRVTSDYLKFGSEYYKNIPLNVTDAVAEGWELYTPPTLPTGLEALVLYCPSVNNLTACAFYDDTEYIAGMQYSYNKECVTNPGLDMNVQGFSNWTVTYNGTELNFWTSFQFYVNADYLATSSATRVANRVTDSILQLQYIWVSGFNGDLYSVPTDVTALTSSNQGLTQQACLPFMGNHYNYNLTNSTECSASSLLPYSFVAYSGQFVGYALTVYANNTCGSNWYEYPSRTAAELNQPYAPSCLYDMVEEYGMLLMHTFVVDKPYYISCAED